MHSLLSILAVIFSTLFLSVLILVYLLIGLLYALPCLFDYEGVGPTLFFKKLLGWPYYYFQNKRN